ncbi:MAG: glycolate oxidase subunit GlcE [Methylococcaceae bacterium]|nr:glycolate oxidase subunit GlcE [Methylococcaceae bacterium]
MQDISADLRSAILDAIDRKNPLNVQGGGSKSFYGREAHGRILKVAGHRGILHYEPTELVLSARCGTPLDLIENTLAGQGQMLGFEPPHFGSSPTLGGAVASGLSGPRRPFSGSVRDFVLGCRVINGRGEILSFGGEVMKNVAGYDLSRLMAGSLGTLAVILEISLKVVPRPEIELTLRQELGEREAIEKMNRWQGRPLPITALAWHRGLACIRLSGGQASVSAASRKLGGEELENGGQFWDALRDQKLPFFRSRGNLWRLALKPAAPAIERPGDWFYEWGGAQRWCVSEDPSLSLFERAAGFGGHATLFRTLGDRGAVFQPLSEEMARIHERLKKAFDPHGVLNPGRMYSSW